MSNPFFSSSTFELGSALKTDEHEKKPKGKVDAQSALLPKQKAQGRRASPRAVQRYDGPTND